MANPPREPDDAEAGQACLLRIVYVSLAARPLAEPDLGRIEESSRRRNAAAGITGLLIVHEPFFYGVMEGPCARLLARMEAIVIDRRHRRLRILREEPVPARRFVNWRLFCLPGCGAVRGESAPSVDFILDLARRLG